MVCWMPITISNIRVAITMTCATLRKILAAFAGRYFSVKLSRLTWAFCRTPRPAARNTTQIASICIISFTQENGRKNDTPLIR